MKATETTTTTSLRKALRIIRSDIERMRDAGQDYLPGALEYQCEYGTIYVRNKPCDGGCLLGLFEAELVNRYGDRLRKYEV